MNKRKFFRQLRQFEWLLIKTNHLFLIFQLHFSFTDGTESTENLNSKQNSDDEAEDDDEDDYNENLDNESTTCNPDQSDKELQSVSENSDNVSSSNVSTKPTCSRKIKQENGERNSSWSKKARYGNSSDSFSNSSSSGSSTSPRQLFSRSRLCGASSTNFNNSSHASTHHHNHLHHHNDHQSYRNFNGHSNINHYSHHSHHQNFNNYRHKKQANNSSNFHNRFNHSNHSSNDNNNNIHNSNEIQILNNHQLSSSQNTGLTSHSSARMENSNHFADVSFAHFLLNKIKFVFLKVCLFLTEN